MPAWEDKRLEVKGGRKVETTVEYPCCPGMFIPQSLGEFFRLYGYRRDFPSTAPAVEALSARYLEARDTYEADLAEFREMVEEERRRAIGQRGGM